MLVALLMAVEHSRLEFAQDLFHFLKNKHASWPSLVASGGGPIGGGRSELWEAFVPVFVNTAVVNRHYAFVRKLLRTGTEHMKR